MSKLKSTSLTIFTIIAGLGLQCISPVAIGQSGSCSDMGAEGGWGNWKAATGDYASPGGITWNATGLAPGSLGNRFVLNSSTGKDPCTPGGGGPAVPYVAPGFFGSTSIQLGRTGTNGSSGGCNAGCVERLTYDLAVTAADTNFVYAYAIILENPTAPSNPHHEYEVPYAEIYMLDSNGDTIPCSYKKYMGDTTGSNTPPPGMYKAVCQGPGNNGLDVAYKPWQVVGVNLSMYINQTIRVIITNSDCALGGHFCYSFWDFMCPPVAGAVAPFCMGGQTTITGPASSPDNPYTYQWYQNGSPYTGPPGATTHSITPSPVPGDTFSVHVKQSSGCSFWMPFIPQPTAVTAGFSFSGGCGKMTFTDSSSITPFGPGNTITNWSWQFPGGTPSSSSAQNPGNVSYPPGTYTVTLIVTSSAGCRDTIQNTFNIPSLPPVANFTAPPVCAGSTTSFSNLSGGANSWTWNFGDGSPGSSVQHPTHTYAAPGTYIVTLIASSGICGTDTFSIPVTVNPLPVANPSGSNACFNNANVFRDLSVGNNTITSWAWNFGDGTTSAQANPGHTYGNAGTYQVSLTVTNNFGCVSSKTIAVVVNPLPVAGFSTQPVCLRDSMCFSNLSSIASGSVTGWSWNFGDPGTGAANISNLQNPCHTFSGTGPFTVFLTVTSDSGCQGTTSLPAVLHPLPVSNFTAPPVCLGMPVTFTDRSTITPGTIIGWSWDFGDNTGAAVRNPVHTYPSAGTYTATLIVTTAQGCRDTIDKPITIYALPVAAFTSPDSGCAPVCKTFQDLSIAGSGSVASWQWNFPGGDPGTSFQQDGYACWDKPGSYGVGLVVTNTYGCRDTLFIPDYIKVFDTPIADFCVSPNKAPTADPVFSFCPLWSPNPGVTQWMWNFGDGSPVDSVHTHPVHSYSASAAQNDFYSFNICLYVRNKHGCWDSVCKPVELMPEFTFYIPNCVTPNGDFINERFFGKSRGVKDYNIWVFDRWGNLIWDCHYSGKNVEWDQPGQDGMSAACQWDAKVVPGGMDMNGRSRDDAQEDVYVWKVRLTDIFGKVHSYVGHVSIVK